MLSCARFFATPWTAAHQAPVSMRFSRQGYWSGLPFPSPRKLLDPGIKAGSPTLQADSLLTELQGKPYRLSNPFYWITLLFFHQDHSSIRTWGIPWTEQPCGLQFMGSQRAGYNWATNIFTFSNQMVSECISRYYFTFKIILDRSLTASFHMDLKISL